MHLTLRLKILFPIEFFVKGLSKVDCINFDRSSFGPLGYVPTTSYRAHVLEYFSC